MDRILIGLDRKRAAADIDRVVDLDAVIGRLDDIAAAGDLQIVLAADAVAVVGDDRQCAETVERQIVLREDDGVGVGLAVGDKAAGDRQCVAAALDGRDKDLVGLDHIDAGQCVVRDTHTVEHELHLGLFVGDRDLDDAVCGGAAENIGAALGDLDRTVIADREACRLAEIGTLGEIALGVNLAVGTRTCCGAQYGDAAGAVLGIAQRESAAAAGEQSGQHGRRDRGGKDFLSIDIFHGSYLLYSKPVLSLCQSRFSWDEQRIPQIVYMNLRKI